MIDKLLDARKWVIGFFIALCIGSAALIPTIEFSFDFEQFFPQGDDDLAFFQDFVKEFETDDNFLLIAIEKQPDVFDSTFLRSVQEFTLACRDMPHAVDARSLTNLVMPRKTPFGLTTVPMLHLDDPSFLAQDKQQILSDERLVYALIDSTGESMVVFMTLVNSIQLEQAKELMGAVDAAVAKYGFDKVHFLGRPYFQVELVQTQQRELMYSFLVSGILVTIILFLIFRRFWGVALSVISLLVGMLIFVGFLALTGSKMSVLAALYPILMIIVGTSDVIHILTKYVDELKKGLPRRAAIKVTIKEIGLATLLTSLTTAIGFATLMTSRIYPVSDFGFNAAIGVGIAYTTVILLTTCLLTYFDKEQIARFASDEGHWDGWMHRVYRTTVRYPKAIAWGSVVLVGILAFGVSQITTNYQITDNLPIGEKVTEDFLFFEKNYAGFRPYELAVMAQGDYKVSDYKVMEAVDKVTRKVKSYDAVRTVTGPSTLVTTINEVMTGQEVFPKDTAQYASYWRMSERVADGAAKALISKDGTKARISARMLDTGADSVANLNASLRAWMDTEIDSTVVRFRQTGTGLMVDKNAMYVRESLLYGLVLAIVLVSVLMALLFQNWRMLFIALIPNLIPLLFAGALLGYLGIELEAGISIVFGIIFGIAVDDSIHFLGRYKLLKVKGIGKEKALEETFRETGKALVLTTIILFFGFLVLLFSVNPPSLKIGLLISTTLISALLGDLLLLPVLIRWWGKD